MDYSFNFNVVTHTISAVPCVRDCVKSCLEAKAAGGLRPRYLDSLRIYLGHFAAKFGERPVNTIHAADLEDWFLARHEAPATRKSNLGRLGALFKWAWRRGYIENNPCARVERVKVDVRPPVILTPAQAQRMTRYIATQHPAALPYFTACLYCGIRPSEAQSLEWRDIDLDRKTIRLDAAVSKVRRRRFVTIAPNALAWFRLGGELPYGANQVRYLFAFLRHEMGWERWPQDLLRHTAASMMLARDKDVGRVARELGNSPHILLSHYIELVSDDDAVLFWNIRPENEEQKAA